ncbi:hypothetical protein M758_6G132800 [Ceratodon purpureus]|nr:hypothetical protein M758_6G132800 [Ceratodon purpureus]
MDWSFFWKGFSSNPRGRLKSKDLPSLRRLGRDLSGFIYETTWRGNKYSRKDFPIGADEHNSIFKKEVRSLLDLNHPNIVKCYGYTVGRSSCSLLQEFVDDNIQDAIRRRREAQIKTAHLLSSKGKEKERTLVSNEASSSNVLGSRTIPIAVSNKEVLISSSEGKERVKNQTASTLPSAESDREVVISLSEAEGRVKTQTIGNLPIVMSDKKVVISSTKGKERVKNQTIRFDPLQILDVACASAPDEGKERVKNQTIRFDPLQILDVACASAPDAMPRAKKKGPCVQTAGTLSSAESDMEVVILSSEAKERVETQTISCLPFELSEAKDITLQIASGMEYLHKHGVAHGDLKPKNVLVCLNPDAIDSDKMTVKVADFGLAQTKSRIKLVSKRSQHFETLMWKAPELFAELRLGSDYSGESDDDEVQAEVDGEENKTYVPFLKSRLAMADVYSFGLTCAHIWGGKLLYPELSLTELLKQRIGGFRPELPNSICPKYINHIVGSCLEFDPSKRPTFSTICSSLDLFCSSPELFDVMKDYKMEDMIDSTTTLNLEDFFEESTGEFVYLTRFPPGIYKLTSLKTLSLGKCQLLEQLPDEIGNLVSLMTLKLMDCSSLKVLPSSIGNLKALETLSLCNCEGLEELPNEIGDLASLTTLELIGCSSLKVLPPSIGNSKALETVSLCNCQCFEQLPDEIGNLASLRTLKVKYCPNLKVLPQTIGNLKALETLSLWNCPGLEQLPNEIGDLTSLMTLELNSCVNLKVIPQSIGKLKALETLVLITCKDLEELPNEIGDLASLITLKLKYCSSLKVFPSSIGNLKALETLSLWNCPSLEELPDEIGDLASLTTLELKYCSSLKVLPSSIGNLKALETLSLWNCPSLEELPDEIGDLASMTTLELKYCSSLKVLPSSIGNLKALTTLNLKYCRGLEQLPDEIGNLASLTTLELKSCSGLKVLPSSIGNLKTLTIVGQGALVVKDNHCLIDAKLVSSEISDNESLHI